MRSPVRPEASVSSRSSSSSPSASRCRPSARRSRAEVSRCANLATPAMPAAPSAPAAALARPHHRDLRAPDAAASSRPRRWRVADRRRSRGRPARFASHLQGALLVSPCSPRLRERDVPPNQLPTSPARSARPMPFQLALGLFQFVALVEVRLSLCGRSPRRQQPDAPLGHETQRAPERVLRLPQAAQFHLQPGPPDHGRERPIGMVGGAGYLQGLREGFVGRSQVPGDPEREAQAGGREAALVHVLVGQQRARGRARLPSARPPAAARTGRPQYPSRNRRSCFAVVSAIFSASPGRLDVVGTAGEREPRRAS